VRHAAYMPGKNLPWLDRVDMVVIVARVPHGTRRCSCDVHPLEIRVAHPRQPPAMKSHVVRHLQHNIITTATSSETEVICIHLPGPAPGKQISPRSVSVRPWFRGAATFACEPTPLPIAVPRQSPLSQSFARPPTSSPALCASDSLAHRLSRPYWQRPRRKAVRSSVAGLAAHSAILRC